MTTAQHLRAPRGFTASGIFDAMGRRDLGLLGCLIALLTLAVCDDGGSDGDADADSDVDGDIDGDIDGDGDSDGDGDGDSDGDSDADADTDEDVEEPACAAVDGAACWYVAVDGDDGNAGTIEAPFLTFGAAVTRAGPGDYIYARGGTYGQDNAMVSGVSRDHDSHPATSCPEGQVLADEYCFSDRHAMIAIRDFSGWASNTPAFEVPSGEEGRPITVRNFPGEHPVLDVTDFSQRVVAVGLEAFWVIQGFEMIGGNVNIGGGSSEAQVHDITIRGNDIHDLTLDGGDNPGLVRIDRGDIGGPYNIFVLDNELHGIYDWEQPGEWSGVPDAQHFGAVTTLSRENYFGFDGGGTGHIVIANNDIYHCPQAFFFKNPMAGPIEIHDNVIHQVGNIGDMGAANVEFVGNLVYEVRSGFWKVGNGGYDDERLHAIAGQDATIAYNTFVGLDSLLGIRCGTGHTVTNNVFFGLTGEDDGASWDTPSFISKSGVFPDSMSVEESLLQDITSDDNCFYSAVADFQMAARYLPPEATGADWVLEHYSPAEALAAFGFDPSSSFHVEDDATAVFRDPDGGDYRLLDPSACPDMGYEARPDS